MKILNVNIPKSKFKDGKLVDQVINENQIDPLTPQTVDGNLVLPFKTAQQISLPRNDCNVSYIDDAGKQHNAKAVITYDPDRKYYTVFTTDTSSN